MTCFGSQRRPAPPDGLGADYMDKKGLHRFTPLIGLVLFVVALWVLHHELRQYHIGQILALTRQIPRERILLSLGLMVLSYLSLTGYDTLALNYIRHPLPYPKIGLASFVGYAFSNNVSHGPLSGGAVRLHLYTSWGLSAAQIAKILLFNMATLWLGLFLVAGLALLAEPIELPPSVHLPAGSSRLLGTILAAIVLTYVLLNVFRKRPLTIRSWQLPLPGVRRAVMQFAVASADWCLAAAVLYVLLPPAEGLTYVKFLRFFLVAQLMAMVSQVPGGLGIFETSVVILVQRYLDASQMLASLLAFRVIYYILPLASAMLLFGAYEAARRRERVKRLARFFVPWVPRLVPHMLALTAFAAGAVLLFSGALPPLHSRMHLLRSFLPLPLIEISHFLGSLVGVGLLILARGLQRRVRLAYALTAGLLVLGVAFSLLKDFDYEEAVILLVMLAGLLPCRREFYREASVLDQPFTPGWIAAIAAVMIAALWLAVVSHKLTPYSTEPWWQFAFQGGAPLGLRASLGVAVILLAFGIARLLSPHQPEPVAPTPDQIDQAYRIVEKTDSTFGYFALMGDKSLLFSESGDAFIMYGIEGRSWVALGDPVGNERDMPELVWRFREMVDRHDGLTIFYQVPRAHLHLYLDLGLTVLKLGEEALVPLRDFSLEGHGRKDLRQAQRHVQREGGTFEVIPRQRAAEFIQEFRQISDAWLEQKHTREKGFSIASFDERYLSYFPAAVVRQGDRIVAFANVMCSADKRELSLELMRYLPDAPHGVMDFLFIELMLWGRQQGYERFNLGMVPLAGLQRRSLAPAWNRFGAILFRVGEHFFNFQGLRQYKAKFQPVWEPKFIASPGGLAMPRILANIAALISRGIVGVVAK
jgi:phosphatidylglycerol lysyltransferase